MRLLIALIYAISATTQMIPKENHKTYRVTPSTLDHLHILQTFENNMNVDFPTRVVEMIQPLNLNVAPQFQAEFQHILDKYKIPYRITMEDTETHRLEKESTLPEMSKISFDKYYRYSEIDDYLDKLTAEKPNVVVKERYGSSYENRSLNLIRISTGGNDQKPIIFVDGGIHAREFIASSQILFIIHSLLERPENHHMIENVDWVIIPLLNPDGYEYAHTEERFWRKTRSKGQDCDGVDLNRNFGYHWMEAGASDNECAGSYAGQAPFSEPESFALSKVLKRFGNRTKLYLTYHSPIQSILYPWGYTKEPPSNVDELHGLAADCAKIIENVNGRKYRIGSSFNVGAPAAGSSRDYAYGEVGIDLAYTMELPAGGEKRFDFPLENVFEVVSEMFECIKFFHNYIEQKYAT